MADVTFDWRHVMVTAVERNNQTRRIITFLCRLYARFKQKRYKNCVNIRDEFHFSEVNGSMNATGPVQSKWRPTLHVIRCVHLRNKFHFFPRFMEVWTQRMRRSKAEVWISCDYGIFHPPQTHSSNAHAQPSSGATPYATSFRRRFFAYHQTVKHSHTSIILS